MEKQLLIGGQFIEKTLTDAFGKEYTLDILAPADALDAYAQLSHRQVVRYAHEKYAGQDISVYFDFSTGKLTRYQGNNGGFIQSKHLLELYALTQQMMNEWSHEDSAGDDYTEEELESIGGYQNLEDYNERELECLVFYFEDRENALDFSKPELFDSEKFDEMYLESHLLQMDFINGTAANGQNALVEIGASTYDWEANISFAASGEYGHLEDGTLVYFSENQINIDFSDKQTLDWIEKQFKANDQLNDVLQKNGFSSVLSAITEFFQNKTLHILQDFDGITMRLGENHPKNGFVDNVKWTKDEQLELVWATIRFCK